MLAVLRRYLGVQGVLLAFVAVDVIGVVLVFQLVRLAWVGIAAAAIAVVITIVGFRTQSSGRARLATLAALVFLLLFLPLATVVILEPANAAVIDGVLLNDAAADRLLSGHDPYVGDYLNTQMRAFYLSDVPVNFGLVRMVYMPGMALLDANLSWLFLPGLVALAAAAWSLGLRPAEKQATLIAVVLSPIFQEDYLYLLNDVFFLAPALAGIAFLRRNRPLAAGAMLGLSLAMKQQAVLFLPLLGLYALLNLDRRSQLRMAAGFTAVLAVLVGPFLLWDPKAFVSGTAAFFYGSGVDSYPIRGIGLQGLLLRAGVIPNRWDAFPSAQIQVPLLVIVLILLALAALLVLAGPRSPGGVRLRAGAGAQLPRPLPGLLPGRLRLSLGRRDASSCRRRRCRSAPAPRRRNKSHH
ncbi:MAG: DUF2029 domain-containing protein [Chloroflexi bacterium]|nr:MAG: DUF2029 domain-containing protein [Chloroflexota bacterium]